MPLYTKKVSKRTQTTIRSLMMLLFLKDEESKQKNTDDHQGYGDELFFYIFEKACPEEPKKYFGDAVEVLMSYYFECCDIFEPPKTTLFD